MKGTEKDEYIKRAYMEIENSKHKVGDILYNKKTKWTGPIQRISHSMRVTYYHGNNPCNSDDLVELTERRSLSGL